MAFNVNDFKQRLPGQGARPSLYEVQLTFPVGTEGAAGDAARFLIRTAALPGSTVGTIPVQYFGRTIKLAGDRTFDPWTTTIINDEDFKIRRNVELWMNLINTHESNVRLLPAYKTRAQITQFGKSGNRLRTYTFEGFYPTDLQEIAVDYGNVDTIEEFTCVWNYDYWLANGEDNGTSILT
jgi:hypothetical protein